MLKGKKKLFQLCVVVCKYVFRHMSECRSSCYLNSSLSSLFFFFIVSENHSVVSTLCDPMDCIVRGIFQARVLEWVAFPFSSGLSQPRNQTQVSCIAGGFFTNWAMREALFIVDWVQLQRITLILRVKLKNKSHICCFRKNLLQNA